LRHADAHLASSDIKNALALTNVDENAPYVIQGYQLLDSCVSALFSIAEVLGKPTENVQPADT